MGDDEFQAPIAIRKYKEMVDGEGIKVIGGTLSGGISRGGQRVGLQE